MDTMTLSKDISELPELNTSNHILGDAAALADAWNRDGYWYFRGAIDPEALKPFQKAHLDQLVEYGVVEPGATEPLYNGRKMADLPKQLSTEYGECGTMQSSNPWRAFVADPRIRGFLTRVLGKEPVWIPVAESRMLPPDRGDLLKLNRLIFPHQDGFYNEGYKGRNCWFPLFDMPRASVGGLAVAQGMHKGPYFHDLKQAPRCPIPQGAIPEDAWRATDFKAGDLLIFDYRLPHAGIRNRSDKYLRVSFDVRCILDGEDPPVVGHVVTASFDSIVVKDEQGRTRTIPADEETYWRSTGRTKSANRLSSLDVMANYPPGQEVMVAVLNGKARAVRPPSY